MRRSALFCGRREGGREERRRRWIVPEGSGEFRGGVNVNVNGLVGYCSLFYNESKHTTGCFVFCMIWLILVFSHSMFLPIHFAISKKGLASNKKIHKEDQFVQPEIRLTDLCWLKSSSSP